MATNMEWLETLTKLAPQTDFTLRCVLAELLGQKIESEILLGVIDMLVKVMTFAGIDPDHASELNKIVAVLLLETGPSSGEEHFTHDRKRLLLEAVGDALPPTSNRSPPP